jgi:hypothetical protein
LKKTAFALLLAISTSVLAAQPAVWSVATANDHGNTLIIRYLVDLPNWANKANLPNLVAISWPFKSPNGIPSPAESALMHDLEDSISEAAEKEKVGVLTMIVTGNGVCELQFYATSHEKFMHVVNVALAGKSRFPINISLQSDPNWSAYAKFAKAK